MKSNAVLRFSASISLVCLTAISCSSPEDEQNSISLSGAFALYPLTVQWAEEFEKQQPEIRFDIQAGGAGKGMADALSGSVDLGMFSREITDEEKERGVWWVPVCVDAVIPTTSKNNPLLDQLLKRGIKKEEFARLFLAEEKLGWNSLPGIESIDPIHIYTRSDASGAAATWAAYIGTTQEQLKGTGVYGDPGLAEAVSKDANGIGYNNIVYIYNPETGLKRPEVEVIPIDINENGKIDPEEDFYDSLSELQDAISNGKYPSPPARELYFVSNQKPSKTLVRTFLKWVLTDGQKYVTGAGYVPLSQAAIDEAVKSIEK